MISLHSTRRVNHSKIKRGEKCEWNEMSTKKLVDKTIPSPASSSAITLDFSSFIGKHFDPQVAFSTWLTIGLSMSSLLEKLS